MQAPPSRYRVVERGGRLVVLDSAIGGAPMTARDLLPAMASDDGADALSLDQYPRENGDPESQTEFLTTLDPRFREDTDLGSGELPKAPPRPAAAQRMIAEPPGLLRNVAATVCSDRRDADGRLQWTTARWFDSKGPRPIALSLAGERQLGFVALALLVSAVVGVILVVMGDVIGWMVVFGAFFLLSRAKPVATLRIDRLATQ